MGRTVIAALDRGSDWPAVRVCVAGIAVAGSACATALAELGADVIAVDAGAGPEYARRAEALRQVGVGTRLGDADTLPEGVDLLVVSPGFPPTAPIVRQAGRAGVPVWGELELAWRLRGPDAAPWLAITGTNGKTTASLMLESILAAAGKRAVAAANIGVPLVDTVMHRELDVIAVEVSAQQLCFMHSVEPFAAVCLNVAQDHIDHFGTYEAYVAAKARIYRRCRQAAVYNVDDPRTLRMVQEAAPACRSVGFRSGVPLPGELGVEDGHLVDRAFVDPPGSESRIARLSDIHPLVPHNVTNALAAAALARAFGVGPDSVGEGLRRYKPAAHRIAEVGSVAGVRYVDDSKATNPHAARTSLLSFDSVVWIAGGQAKGQTFDDLVRECAPALRGAVLLGVDRGPILAALTKHAPAVPVVEVTTTGTEAMVEVVAAAAALAIPGDTVLLAPGCASWDMFDNYAQRGDLFSAAVRNLGSAPGPASGGE